MKRIDSGKIGSTSPEFENHAASKAEADRNDRSIGERHLTAHPPEAFKGSARPKPSPCVRIRALGHSPKARGDV